MKFKNADFHSVKTFARSIEMMRKIILESLDDSIDIRFPLNWSKSSFDRYSISLDRSRLVKLNYLQNFLVTVEPNNLVVSWGQVCGNPLATRLWEQILSKDNNFVPPSYLIFYLSFVFTLFFLDYFVYYPQQIKLGLSVNLSTDSSISGWVNLTDFNRNTIDCWPIWWDFTNGWVGWNCWLISILMKT